MYDSLGSEDEIDGQYDRKYIRRLNLKPHNMQGWGGGGGLNSGGKSILPISCQEIYVD